MYKQYSKILLLTATVLVLNSNLPTYKAYAVDSSLNSSDNVLNSKTYNESNLENNLSESNDNNLTSSNNFPKSDSTSNNTTDDVKNTDPNNKDASNSNKEKDIFIDYGWKTINGKKYYIVNNEILKHTQWFSEKDVNPNLKEEDEHYNDVYYLNDDYSVTIGWKKIDGNWYFFNQEGVMKTGLFYNDHYYYTDKDGIMQTGWQKIDGYTYYFNEENGEMAIGKTFINDSWYFFNSDGQLQKGFYENKNKIYYSDNDGKMVFDQWIKTSSHTYYIKSDGTAATGKLFLDGSMEIFDEDGVYLNSDSHDTEHLYVHSLDVGNADSHFIKLPNGQAVLIDTGLPESYNKLSSFLKSQDLKSEDGKPFIDYVILTHPHSDHIGGMISLMEDFNIGKLYIPKHYELEDYTEGITRTSENSDDYDMLKSEYEIYKKTVDAIEDNNINVVIAKSKEYIDDDKILQFVQSDNDFEPKEINRITDKYWAINNNSLIVYLNYHDFQELFTGDMEEEAESDLVSNNRLNGGAVDVIKVPHHGLNSSSSYSFIGNIKPVVGIVPRAQESINTTNNPAQVYRVCGVNLYETSSNDGVTIYATKDNWTVGDLKK